MKEPGVVYLIRHKMYSEFLRLYRLGHTIKE